MLSWRSSHEPVSDENELIPTRNIRPFPKFSKPVIEGFFSLDQDRNYQDSLVNLKYLNIPAKVEFNLNDGDETYVDKSPSAEHEQLNHLLTFIMKNKSRLMSAQHIPDFVCFRGLLRLLMSTPYEEREPWTVLATKFRKTIYLCAEETQMKKAEKSRRSERDIKFMRYGFKFESYILSSHPSKPAPGATRPVKESEEFCAMYGTEIDGKRLLYGAEMDGVISKKTCENLDDLRNVPMVEVKVKRRETNERQLTNFHKFKACKWWLQSFLVGIDAIHVGVRNDDGIVEEVKRVPIKDISDEAKKQDFWHGTVAMNFLNDFLKKVSREMKHIDNPQLVFRYQWDSRRSRSVNHQKFEGHRYAFLTPEFIHAMETT